MTIRQGDTVRVHYTGTLEDGAVFDSSRDRDPLEFVLGKRMLIEGFEKALIGRQAGERLQVIIPAAEAYGDADEGLRFNVPRGELPPHITPEPGLQLSLSAPEGDMEVTVIHVDNAMIVLDANHPLAGKDLTFDIEVVSVSRGNA
ncbi:MAG: peptidylprolyl isomerase [Deltaproteobacteria bacterium]|jgi:peptidylprolyl isomerase|nr:peptidylprolyl isomerase [Deltaproteobacteria bacterium]